MSLKDFLALTDDKLLSTYETPAFDAAKARKSVLKVIDKAIAQFGSTEPAKGSKSWSVNRGVVSFTLPISIGGKSVFLLPSERFGDALTALRAAVEAGEADAELEKQSEGESVAPSKPSGGAGVSRAPWSPERRAKHAATLAARKAKKAK